MQPVREREGTSRRGELLRIWRSRYKQRPPSLMRNAPCGVATTTPKEREAVAAGRSSHTVRGLEIAPCSRARWVVRCRPRGFSHILHAENVEPGENSRAWRGSRLRSVDPTRAAGDLAHRPRQAPDRHQSSCATGVWRTSAPHAGIRRAFVMRRHVRRLPHLGTRECPTSTIPLRG